MSDDNASSVRKYDGNSEVPADMTAVKAFFRDIRTVQVWLEPANPDPELGEQAFLCIPPDEVSDEFLWYRLEDGDLLKVTHPREKNHLRAAFAIYEEERKARQQ